MEILEVKYVQNREEIEKIISALDQKKPHFLDESEIAALCESYNSLSQVLLNEKRIQESLEYLRKSESLAVNHPSLRASVYNTIASFYRKQGKASTALKYIERSLSLCASGNAYLNLCSVLSLQGNYEKSLEIAMHAIIFLQDELFEDLYETKTFKETKIESISAGYYNLAVQLEYLKRSDEANSYYKKSVEFSMKFLPAESAVREILKQIYDKIIAGSLKKFESKRKSEANIKPTTKKRVIIKNATSKSPINKTPPPESSKKLLLTERFQQKLVGPMLSHRKFVQTGVTKSKMIEGISPFLDKEEGSSGEEIVRAMASTQGFTLNLDKEHHKEISLKNKLEIDRILDANTASKKNNNTQRKESLSGQGKKIRVVDGSSVNYKGSHSNSASDCGEFLKEDRGNENEIVINPSEVEAKGLEDQLKPEEIDERIDNSEFQANRFSVNDLESPENLNKDPENIEKAQASDFGIFEHVMEGDDIQEEHKRESQHIYRDQVHENSFGNDKFDEIKNSVNHLSKRDEDKVEELLEDEKVDARELNEENLIWKEEDIETNLKDEHEINMNVLESIEYTRDHLKHQKENEVYGVEDNKERNIYDNELLTSGKYPKERKGSDENHITVPNYNINSIEIAHSSQEKIHLQEENEEFIKDLREVRNDIREDIKNTDSIFNKEDAHEEMSRDGPDDQLTSKASVNSSPNFNENPEEPQQKIYNLEEKNEFHPRINIEEINSLNYEIGENEENKEEKRRKTVAFPNDLKSKISYPRGSVDSINLERKLPDTPKNSPINTFPLGDVSEKCHESSFSSEHESEDSKNVAKKLNFDKEEVDSYFGPQDDTAEKNEAGGELLTIISQESIKSKD